MKRNFKRTLSVFLAALMLMSCWVYVAPQKADAVNSGTYYWRVVVNSGNNTQGWDYGNWTVYGRPNNGVGNEGSISTFSRNVDFNGEKTVGSGSSTSFPSKVTFSYSFGGGLTWREMKGTMYLQVSGDNSSWQNVAEASINASSSAFSAAKGTKTATVQNAAYPSASAAVISTQPSNFTLPPTGTGKTTFKSYLKDQYGVVVSSDAGYARAYSLTGNASSNSKAEFTSTDANADTSTITFGNDEKIAGSTNTKKAKATITYTFRSVTASVTTNEFTVTDPNYKFTYNGNGGTVTPADYTTYYGNPASSIPTTGTRPGYEFIGMYTDKKADNFDFTKPVAGSAENYKNQLTTSTQVNADTTWYAAWWAKNVTATFEDADGNSLGSTTGKYDHTLGQVVSDYDSFISSLGEPEYHRNPSDTGSTFSYKFAGWAVYSAVDADGKDYTSAIGGQSPDEAVLKGDVTFRPVYEVEKNNYTVNFFDTEGVPATSTYSYKDKAVPPTNPTADNYTSEVFTYVFKGWTTTKPEEGKTFFAVDFESKDVDTGKYIPVATDFTVRKDTDYYPVFEKSYEVRFYNANGDKISSKIYPLGATAEKPEDQTKPADKTYTYKFLGWKASTDEIINDFTVVEDIGYFPVFESVYIDYTVTVNDNFSIGINPEPYTLHYGDEIPVVKEYKTGGYTYTFTGWEDSSFDGTCQGTATYIANYDKTPAVYDVNFVEADGETQTVQVNHGETLSEIPEPKKSVYVDDNGTDDDLTDDVRYTFDHWEDENGLRPTKAEPITADTTYNAEYTSQKAVKVTYLVNSVETYVTAAFPGDKVPDFVGDEPTKADDEYAKNYKFKGWADKDGKEVTTMPEEDVVLYAQFEGDKITYTVKFVDEDGKVLDERTYTYGETLEIPNTDKEADLNYKYEFKSWEPSVPETCRGDATYTAIYKKTRILYKVTFLNDDDSTIVTRNYINGARIVPPLNPVSTQTPEVGYSMKFVGWQREDGTMFDADRIQGKSVTYKAVYEQVGADCTITFVVEGESTKVPVKYGDTVGSASIEAAKKPEADGHYVFSKWLDDEGREVPLETVVTADMTLTAEFEKEDHNLKVEVLEEPTFTVGGRAFKYCEDCGYEFEPEDIEKLQDTVKPTGELAIDDNYWQTQTPVDFKNDEPTPVSIKGFLDVYTNDKANVNEDFNPKGTGSGVAKIEIKIGIDGEQSDWQILSENQLDTTQSNYTKRLGDIAIDFNGYNAELRQILTDGLEFAVYIRITDRVGNQFELNSGLLICDESSPIIKLETMPTYDADLACQKVRVNVEATRYTMKVTRGGVEVEPNEEGFYTEPGKYTVVVTNVVGNKTTTTFTIKDHDWLHYEKDATCVENGYHYDECKVCDVRRNYEEIQATGAHKYGKGTYHAGDCTTPGYTLYVCEVCGDYYREEEPAEGHKWVTVSIEREPNCIRPGYGVRRCSVCGVTEGYEIPIDPSKHNWKLIERVAPTIYDTGYEKYKCLNCGKTRIEEPGKVDSFAFQVKVTDSFNKAVPNAKVSIYQNGVLILTGYTDSEGIDTFLVQSGRTYTFDILVEAADHTKKVYEDVVITGSTVVNLSDLQHDARDEACTCTCHKDGFFPAIFRFFQKIVKLFSGKAKCCNDPDSRI